MKRIGTLEEWRNRAAVVLPAAGFGNYDASVIISHGKGANVWDVDGKEYTDLLIGSGPMLLGHGNEEVEEAVFAQIPSGMTFFANNPLGIELAEKIADAVPCVEQLRFVSSGGEADMYAIRLARAYTNRTKIIKFEGGYHGMSAEAQMSLAPDARLNFPSAQPDSAGIPKSVAEDVLIAPYNDLAFIHSLLAEKGNEVAALIVEPLQRIIPAEPGFLQGLKDAAHKYGVLLIFDEIVTGFRLAFGGAQERLGVIPDIVTLGKIIGGGFPLAATGASAEIMQHFDKSRVGKENWLMQLGTLSGNPVASVAGMKTMEILAREGAYDKLRKNGQRLQSIQKQALDKLGVQYKIVGDETLFDIVFAGHEIRNYRDTQAANHHLNSVYNAELRAHGIFKSPTKNYPSLALKDTDFERFEKAVESACREVSRHL